MRRRNAVPDIQFDGIPVLILQWAKGNHMSDVYRNRLKRFTQYYEKHSAEAEKILRAWRAIEKNSRSEQELITLFMVMPDKPDSQPYSALYGRRKVGPDAERNRYVKCLRHVRAIEQFCSPHGKAHQQFYRQFLVDACTDQRKVIDARTGEKKMAIDVAREFLEVEPHFLIGLRKLESLLEVLDPGAKYETRHPDSPNAALHTYIYLMASLNRYLERPQHAALALLAGINCPESRITADAIRKSWQRQTDKST